MVNWIEAGSNRSPWASRTVRLRSPGCSPTRSFMKRWACSKCGGVVDTINKIWYERGLEHGAKR